MLDVIIIGAGIVGSFIARDLSKYKIKGLVLEGENDIANGTSKANTALVHAGYDARPGSLMAQFNVRGNPMFDQVCQDLYVDFKRPGSLVLGFNEDDAKTIHRLYEKGQANGVTGLEILNRQELLRLEPNLGDQVIIGLHAKTGGIVGPWELAIGLMENAMDNGMDLKLNSQVENIKKIDGGYLVESQGGSFKTRMVINAAGLFADKINNMVSQNKISIKPVAGEYYLLDKTASQLVNKIIFQCPSEDSKGVVVAPTVHGNILVGPDSIPVASKSNKATHKSRLDLIKARASKSIKDIPFKENITNFTGLRAVASSGDFIIEEAPDAKNFINVAGIKSPGLSSAPAIGDYVAQLAVELLGDIEKNPNFQPKRRKPIVFKDLSNEDKNRLIQEDRAYGNIICRCESITEGEIVDSINRKAGATTVDGVKKRVRPGMGRCQGGFCMPRVMEILARELDIPMEDVKKSSLNSYILTGRTK